MDEFDKERDVMNSMDLTEGEVECIERFLEETQYRIDDMFEVEKATNTKFVLDSFNKTPKEDRRVALFSTLQEFFSCFLLMGYDLEGNDVSYKFTPNKLMDTAISKRVQDESMEQKMKELEINRFLFGVGGGDAEEYED